MYYMGGKIMLIDKIKAIAKEDADLSEVEGLLGNYINATELTKDNFIDVAKKYPNLMSAHDSIVSRSVENGVNNFKEKGMLEILKEREEAIRSEIMPKETPAEKRIRELEAKIKANEDKEILLARQDELSIAAKDLGFEPLLARKLAKLDNAEDVIKDVIEWHNGVLGTKLKGQYPANTPKSGVDISKGLSDMKDSELYAAAQADPANRAAIIEEVNRRMRPK